MATKTSTANGNSSDPTKWTPAGAPVEGDKVIINHQITLNATHIWGDDTSTAIQVNSGGRLIFPTTGSAVTLTCKGELVIKNGGYLTHTSGLNNRLVLNYSASMSAGKWGATCEPTSKIALYGNSQAITGSFSAGSEVCELNYGGSGSAGATVKFVPSVVNDTHFETRTIVAYPQDEYNNYIQFNSALTYDHSIALVAQGLVIAPYNAMYPYAFVINRSSSSLVNECIVNACYFENGGINAAGKYGALNIIGGVGITTADVVTVSQNTFYNDNANAYGCLFFDDFYEGFEQFGDSANIRPAVGTSDNHFINLSNYGCIFGNVAGRFSSLPYEYSANNHYAYCNYAVLLTGTIGATDLSIIVAEDVQLIYKQYFIHAKTCQNARVIGLRYRAAAYICRVESQCGNLEIIAATPQSPSGAQSAGYLFSNDSGAFFKVSFVNCTLDTTAAMVNATNMALARQGSSVKFVNKNNLANEQETYTPGYNIIKDNSVSYSGTGSSLRIDFLRKGPARIHFTMICPNNSAATLSGYIKLNSQYLTYPTYNGPSLQAYSPGFAVSPISPASWSVDTWQSFSATSNQSTGYSATTDIMIIFAAGTAGAKAWIDGFNWASGAAVDIGTLDYWSDATPVESITQSLVSAGAIWSIDKSTLDVPNSIGEQVANKILTTNKFMGLK